MLGSGVIITLTSAAFSGCTLTPVSSTFPGQGQDPAAGGINLDNTVTVTGSQGSTFSLTAEYLSYDTSFPKDKTSLTASWRLEGCPAVRQLASSHDS